MKIIYNLLSKIRSFILSFPGYKDISDINTNLFFMVIPGFQHKGNLHCFDYAIRNLPSKSPVVEIGSFGGLSTTIIGYYLNLHKKPNRIVCSDPWNIPLESGVERRINAPVISKAQLKNFVKDSFIRSIKRFGRNNLPYLVEGYSNVFFKLWGKQQTVKDILGRRIKLGGRISFCYIDGDHSYLQTKKDFINVDKYLEKKGFMLFDDSAPYGGFELANLMKEICANKNYRLIARNPNFLFMKIR